MINDIENVLNKFESSRILLFGDIMVDDYVYGNVTRKSQEDPNCDIFLINNIIRKFGGAGNVFNNLKEFTKNVFLFSIEGWDEKYYNDINNFLGCDTLSESLHSIHLEYNRKPTIKTRHIVKLENKIKQILRVDSEDNYDISSESEKKLLADIDKIIETGYINKNNIILLEDYNKGLFTENICNKFKELKKQGYKILLDPNSKNKEKYINIANLITPNRKELFELADERQDNFLYNFVTADLDINLHKTVEKVYDKFQIENIVVTLGDGGISSYYKGEFEYNIPALKVNCKNVVGAGDTVISIIALGLSARLTNKQSYELANICAGLVVSKETTDIISKNDILGYFNNGK